MLFRSGAVLTDAFAGAGTGDLAIVPLRADRSNLRQVEGLIDELSDRLAGSLFIVDEASDASRDVVVLFEGDERDLKAAAALSEHLQCPLHVLAVEVDASAPSQHLERATHLLSTLGDRVSVEPAPGNDDAALMKHISADAPGTLVIDRDRISQRRTLIADALRQLNTSIYLRD